MAKRNTDKNGLDTVAEFLALGMSTATIERQLVAEWHLSPEAVRAMIAEALAPGMALSYEQEKTLRRSQVEFIYRRAMKNEEHGVAMQALQMLEQLPRPTPAKEPPMAKPVKKPVKKPKGGCK